jgi:MFS family permease
VAVLYVAGGLVTVGALWLASLRGTEPPVHAKDPDGHDFALSAPGMLLLTVATLPVGAVFASAEVSAVAFSGQHGHRGLSGVALACIAAGSGVSGLVYGSRARHGDLVGQFRKQALLFAVLPFVLLVAVNMPTLFAADFVLGLGIAPALIAAFGLASQLVPARSLTEGLTWINTGLGVGYGVGAALVGGIADQHGARTAFLVVIASALLVGVLGWAVHAQVRRHESDRAAQAEVVAAEWEHR